MSTEAGNSPATLFRQIGPALGGFVLSLLVPVLCAVGIVYFLETIWAPPQSILAVFTGSVAFAAVALTASWLCLLKILKNPAARRGVHWQFYLVTATALVGLALLLFR